MQDDTPTPTPRPHRLHGLDQVPAWLRRTEGENRAGVTVGILAAVALQLLAPSRYGVRPAWLLPTLELVLLVVLIAQNPVRLSRPRRSGRAASILLVAAVGLNNAAGAVLLQADIINARASNDALGLLRAGATVYLTNVVAFGLLLWELDRGGPFARMSGTQAHPELLFPQMASPELAPREWEPQFLDYLYVSWTNALAFSPTDTLPLSLRMKGFMALQSLIALTTIGLVIARAVNVLR